MFKNARKYISNLRHATATRNWGNVDFDDDTQQWVLLPSEPAWRFVLRYLYNSVRMRYCKHDYAITDTGGPEYGPCIWGECRKCGHTTGPHWWS